MPLYTIDPRATSRPKGLAAYRPQSKTRITVQRVLDMYGRLAAADALPAGPRTIGYRLKETYVGDYTKADFPAIGDVIVRLQQSGQLPWGWVADASSRTDLVDGWTTPDEFLAEVPDMYERDRRERQTTVVEVYTESRETLALISRVGGERGATVYSGGGSCGPNLAHKVARRALGRAVKHQQDTLILGICDFDQAGIRNVLRPHIEHLAAFVYGTSGNEKILAVEDDDGKLLSIDDTPADVSFAHLALTPEMALDLVETDQDRGRVAAYIQSGADVWSRDLDLLDGAQKVELEALDPVVQRDLVVDAIENTIDRDVLDVVIAEEVDERAALVSRLGGAS